MRVEGYYHRFLAALSHPGGSSVSLTGHGAGELGGTGLLSASRQPAPAGTGSGPEQRRRHSLGHRGAAPAAGSRAVHRRGGRELCFRARGHPQSTPTWAGCFAGCSIPEPDPGLWLDGSNGRRKCSCPEAAGKPGCSIRQSWSWVRWSVPLGCPTAGSVRCGLCVRRLSGKRGVLPQHRPGNERNQAESPRDRGDNPLAGPQFVEVAGPVTGRIQPSEPGSSG